MSHTHTNLLFHIVFSTQGHLPLLTENIRPELFAYMASLIKEKKGKPHIINGVDDPSARRVCLRQRAIC